MTMKKNKTLVVLALLFIGIVVACVSWKLLIALAFVVALWYIVDMGEEKFFAFVKEAFVDIFTYGKEKIKEAAQNDVEQELEIHDVTVDKNEDGTFALSVFTERGKLTLEPRSFDIIPKELQKGRRVLSRDGYTWVGAKIQKSVTLTAIGKDKEERLFRVQTEK